MKMSRYMRSTSKNKLYYSISPIFIPTSNHNLPGLRRDRRRPPAVGWSYLPIITWSLLPSNFSPTGAIHQHSGCAALTSMSVLCLTMIRRVRFLFTTLGVSNRVGTAFHVRAFCFLFINWELIYVIITEFTSNRIYSMNSQNPLELSSGNNINEHSNYIVFLQHKNDKKKMTGNTKCALWFNLTKEKVCTS